MVCLLFKKDIKKVINYYSARESAVIIMLLAGNIWDNCKINSESFS